MKNFFVLIFSFWFLQGLVFSQVPESFSYQAIAKDANGSCLNDQEISLRISILEDLTSGVPIFQEVFSNVQTSQSGHFQIKIGQGITQGGSSPFSDLKWHGNQVRFIRIELSPNNDLNFQEVGSTELLSVPFAISSANGLRLSSSNNDEFLPWLGANGKYNGVLGGSGEGFNNGVFSLYDENENRKVQLISRKTSTGSFGDMIFWGENGNVNSVLGRETQNHGALLLYDKDGSHRVFVRSRGDSQGAGQIDVLGPNGKRNVEVSFLNSQDDGVNKGFIYVLDDEGTHKAWMGVDGAGRGILNANLVTADVKNFVMPHPSFSEKEIVYASIEGPEAAAYERGTAVLVNGEAEIQFSDHFEIVANSQTMTVLTSPWSMESKGLAIVERNEHGFKVKELADGKGNYQFDWEAKAVRKGYEDYKVIRPKRSK